LDRSLKRSRRVYCNKNIKPPIDRRLPFSEAAVREGLAYIGTHRAKGKIIIDIAPIQ
jgi:NADPH:quinone reductase-like Zn-dependent oxidoreductase